MAKRTINAREFVADVAAGLSRLELMRKFELTPSQLDAVFKKLNRFVPVGPPEQESSGKQPPHQKSEMVRCPACSKLYEAGAFECPHCGVIISKVPGSYLGAQGLSREMESGPGVLSQGKTSSRLGSKLIGTIVILIIVGIPVAFAWNWYQGYKRSNEFASFRQRVRPILRGIAQEGKNWETWKAQLQGATVRSDELLTAEYAVLAPRFAKIAELMEAIGLPEMQAELSKGMRAESASEDYFCSKGVKPGDRPIEVIWPGHQCGDKVVYLPAVEFYRYEAYQKLKRRNEELRTAISAIPGASDAPSVNPEDMRKRIKELCNQTLAEMERLYLGK